jgi:drug/metabolite transporter (DMT)-like permease
LVEVLMALGVARHVFGQKITPRQMIGMAVMMAGVALLLRSQA